MSESAGLPNTSFSLVTPGLQLAVDSTSLGEFKQCPRKYQLSIVEGWQPRSASVHLEFGIWMHSGRELYDRKRAQGHEHESALIDVLRAVLKWTWDSRLDRGWLGDPIKCPQKTRRTLIQSLVWYLDEFGANDPIETVILANGKPAVELSFRFDPDLTTNSGEPYTICGHLDRIGTLGGESYICDLKTTTHALGGHFMAQFSPDNQMSLYDVAGTIVYDVPLAGVIIDGVQVGATFTRFQRGFVRRNGVQRGEWLRDLGYWLRQMELCAEDSWWPMNDKSCGMYGGCQFREVCSRPPLARPLWLKTNFVRRTWDPLKSRG